MTARSGGRVEEPAASVEVRSNALSEGIVLFQCDSSHFHASGGFQPTVAVPNATAPNATVPTATGPTSTGQEHSNMDAMNQAARRRVEAGGLKNPPLAPKCVQTHFQRTRPSSVRLNALPTLAVD